MSFQQTGFVGRDVEIEKIRMQINRLNENVPYVAINIAGEGGIGKTTLLNRIKQEYQSQPDYLVTDVIDFSQTVHQVQSWVLDRIAAVRPDGFSGYRQEVEALQFSDPVDRLHQEQLILNCFIQDFLLEARKQKVLLLFDTTELVVENTLMDFVLNLVRNLNQTVLILAGRFNDHAAFQSRLETAFGPKQVLTFRLAGFSKSEASQFFEQASKARGETIHPDLQENIFLLSQGNPIKIALSLDWLDRGIPLMTEVSHWKPEALKREMDARGPELVARFENALMDGIRNLDSAGLDPLLPQVIKYMAYFHKRFNHTMVEFFFLNHLANTEKKARSDSLLKNLRSLPFVKYFSEDYFVLHDEMMRLVRRYVWDEVEDPDHSLRKTLSLQVNDYYDGELKRLPSPMEKESTEAQRVQYWSLEVEAMFYKMDADFRSGYQKFETLWEALVDKQRPDLAALALSFLKEYEKQPEYSALLQCFIDGYYKGGILLALQNFREAGEVLQEGERHLRETLDRIAQRQRRPIDDHLSKRLSDVYHQLGFCHRSLGNFRQSLESYQQSLNITLDEVRKVDEILEQEKGKIPVREDVLGRKKSLVLKAAETLNGLANVHRLTGDFHHARLECQTSLFLRQSWEPTEVSKSQYVMAMILWEMGGTLEAMRYLDDAEKSCPSEDDITRALITTYRAYILYRAGQPELSIPRLNEAESVFRRKGQFSDLAYVLNLRSRIYRDHPEFAQSTFENNDPISITLNLALEALRIADQHGDNFRRAECHLTLAMHYHSWSHRDDKKAAEYHRKSLKEQERGLELVEKGNYSRLLSFYSQLRAELAFDEHAYEKAFELYSNQCIHATRFKHAVFQRSIDILADRLRSLIEREPLLAKNYAQKILQVWENDPDLTEHYLDLRGEIEEVVRAIQEKDQLERLQNQYRESLLQGEWLRAAEICDDILKIPSLYNDVNRANVLLDKARALHRKAEISTARRLAKVALQTGLELKDPYLLGRSYLALAEILWDATNTAEAADNLSKAEKVFSKSKNKLGMAGVKRVRSFMHICTNDYRGVLDDLGDIVHVFEKSQMESDLAEVWNLMSRVARTNPKNGNLELAREFAERALTKARAIGDTYIAAEAYLNLAFLAFARKDYEKTIQYCEDGMKILSQETHLLRSVLNEVRCMAKFECGKLASGEERIKLWHQAVTAAADGLMEATESKPARLVHTLDFTYKLLMDLPGEAVGGAAEQIRSQWQQKQMSQKISIIDELCAQAVQYHPYIHLEQPGKGNNV